MNRIRGLDTTPAKLVRSLPHQMTPFQGQLTL